MLENINLPEELSRFVGSESRDFAIKASRAYSFSYSMFFFLFAFFWTSFTVGILSAFFWPLLFGREVHFTSNGIAEVASLNNLEPLMFPAIMLVVFLVTGLAMIFSSLYMLFKDGGYFVATPTRLVKYFKGNLQSIDWEQFTGNIEVKNSSKLGDVTLQMRTGKMVSRKNGSDRFVPDTIFIGGIKNVLDVEQICRKRIKENDPTPVPSPQS